MDDLAETAEPHLDSVFARVSERHSPPTTWSVNSRLPTGQRDKPMSYRSVAITIGQEVLNVKTSHSTLERAMSSTTHGAKLISRKPSRASLSIRRRGMTTRDSLRLGEMSARRAWNAAMQLRKTIHLRIVAAFRSQVEGSGPGPTDVDLRLFARIAVAEERLKRALGRVKAHPRCNSETSSMRLAGLVRRGEVQ